VRLAERIAACHNLSVEIRDGESVMGGGSTPGQSLPTRLLAVTHARPSAQALEELLRQNQPPIIARVERDCLLLDLRTVFENQEEEIVTAFQRVAQNELKSGSS
jgi:L-seryl-tRNA(Ser) seleniumtransferase